MATPRSCNTGLGNAGLQNHSDSVRASLLVDPGRGWQSGGKVVATTSAITALNDPPADAVEFPEDGRNVAIRLICDAAASGTVSTEIIMYPFDPGTQSLTTDETLNKTDGNAAGELVATNTFTVSTKTATSPSVTTDTGKRVSDTVVLDRQGYRKMVVRHVAATTVVPASGIESAYRVF